MTNGMFYEPHLKISVNRFRNITLRMAGTCSIGPDSEHFATVREHLTYGVGTVVCDQLLREADRREFF